MAEGTNTSDAERQALLDLAARALLDGDRRYTADEVCARTGCDRATADLLWRAMGFPDVPDGEVAFTAIHIDVRGKPFLNEASAGLGRVIDSVTARFLSPGANGKKRVPPQA